MGARCVMEEVQGRKALRFMSALRISDLRASTFTSTRSMPARATRPSQQTPHVALSLFRIEFAHSLNGIYPACVCLASQLTHDDFTCMASVRMQRHTHSRKGGGDLPSGSDISPSMTES